MRGNNRLDSKNASSSGRRIRLPVISDQRGDLTYIEEFKHVPFPIKRVFYIFNVPHGKTRGYHALRTTEELILAIKGCFDVILDDGRIRERFHLDRPDFGLYIPKMTWVELDCFSSDAVCLVLASRNFDNSDYIRDHIAFISASRRP
jgi:hypothetical protein